MPLSRCNHSGDSVSRPRLLLSHGFSLLEWIEDSIDRLKSKLANLRIKGNLLSESKLCSMIGKLYYELAGGHQCRTLALLTKNKGDNNIITCESNYCISISKEAVDHLRQAQIYFNAQIEIGGALEDVQVQAEGHFWLGRIWSFFGCYDRALIALITSQGLLITKERADNETAIDMNTLREEEAWIKLLMAMEAPCKEVKEQYMRQAKNVLTEVDSLEFLTLNYLSNEINMLNSISENSQLIKKCDSMGIKFMETLNYDQTNGVLPFEERRQREISKWSHLMTNFFDPMHGISKQALLQCIDQIQGMKKDAIYAGKIRVSHVMIYTQLYLGSLYLLALAQEAIGDFDLAQTTLMLCKESCKGNYENETWVKFIEATLVRVQSKVVFKKNYDASREHVPVVRVEQAIQGHLLFSYWEEAQNLIIGQLDKLSLNTSEDDSRVKSLLEKLYFVNYQLKDQDGQRACLQRLFQCEIMTEASSPCWRRFWILKQLHMLTNEPGYLTQMSQLQSSQRTKNKTDLRMRLNALIMILNIPDQPNMTLVADQFWSLLTRVRLHEACFELDTSNANISYFANRKPSKALQKILGQHMIVKTKTKASFSQGINLKRRKRQKNNSEKRTNESKHFIRSSRFKSQDTEDDECSASSSIDTSLDGFVEFDLMEDQNETDADNKFEFDYMEEKPKSTFEDYDFQKVTPTGQIHLDDENEFPTQDQDLRPTVSSKVNGSSYIVKAISVYQPRHVRVKVILDQHRSLLIPCIDDDIATRPTIKWLIDQTQCRAHEIYGAKPIITRLLNSDGSVLYERDWITDIIQLDGQELKAVIAGWNSPTLVQRYLSKITNTKSLLDDVIIKSLSQKTITERGLIDLSGICLVYGEELERVLSVTMDHISHYNDSGASSASFFLDLSDNWLDDRVLCYLASLMFNNPMYYPLIKNQQTNLSINLSGNCIKEKKLGVLELIKEEEALFWSRLDLNYNPCALFSSI